jgi:hypothetical protein
MLNTAADEFLFTQLGANDPEFNLRSDSSFILRRKNTDSTLFVNAIELHGSYSPVTEIALNSTSSIKGISKVMDSDDYTVVKIDLTTGSPIEVFLSNQNSSNNKEHTLTVNGNLTKWTGPFLIK